MIQAPVRLGAPRSAGCLFYVITDPNVFVTWSTTVGTMTPIADYSDAGGRAMAIWSSGGAAAGTGFTVTATRHV